MPFAMLRSRVVAGCHRLLRPRGRSAPCPDAQPDHGAARVEPATSPLMGSERRTDGRHPPRCRRAGRCKACRGMPVRDPDAPVLTNQRDGDALVWSTSADDTAGVVLHAPPPVAGTVNSNGTNRHRKICNRAHRLFLPDEDTLGMSIIIRTEHVHRVETARQPGPGGASLHGAGLVGRVDVTRVQPPADAPVLRTRRRGRALAVTVEGLRQGDLLLPIRWRERPGMDLFDTCEVPVAGRDLGLIRALPERRLGGFFEGPSDRARVLLIPEEGRAAAERLARSGPAQRCVMIDALLWSGVAHAIAETHEEGAHHLRERAAVIVRARPLAPAGAGPAVLLDGIARRWSEASETLGLRTLDEEARDAAASGFLDALDWARIIDTVSFAHGIPMWRSSGNGSRGRVSMEHSGSASSCDTQRNSSPGSPSSPTPGMPGSTSERHGSTWSAAPDGKYAVETCRSGARQPPTRTAS